MDYLIDTTTDSIHSTGGIALVGKIFERIGFGDSTSEVAHPEMLRVFAGLLVQGRTSYEEIDLFRNDRLFRESLDLAYLPGRRKNGLYRLSHRQNIDR